MENGILAILKMLASDGSSGVELYSIIAIIIFLLVYRYFIKPILTEAKRCISVMESQNSSIEEINDIISRLYDRVSTLKITNDENFKVNQLKIDETQKDINEMKNILSQFKGAMMYNSRMFNKELI